MLVSHNNHEVENNVMLFSISFFCSVNFKGVVNCQNSRDKGPPEGNGVRG